MKCGQLSFVEESLDLKSYDHVVFEPLKEEDRGLGSTSYKNMLLGRGTLRESCKGVVMEESNEEYKIASKDS